MRTAAAFLLALGVSFGALMFGGLGTAPALAQDVGTFEGDPGWFGGDEGWFEDERYERALYDEGVDDDRSFEDDTAGLHGEEWWDWGPGDEDPGHVGYGYGYDEAAYGTDLYEEDEHGFYDGGFDWSTGDEEFESWYGASDELF